MGRLGQRPSPEEEPEGFSFADKRERAGKCLPDKYELCGTCEYMVCTRDKGGCPQHGNCGQHPKLERRRNAPTLAAPDVLTEVKSYLMSKLALMKKKGTPMATRKCRADMESTLAHCRGMMGKLSEAVQGGRYDKPEEMKMVKETRKVYKKIRQNINRAVAATKHAEEPKKKARRRKHEGEGTEREKKKQRRGTENRRRQR
jgi:hypothetical protein